MILNRYYLLSSAFQTATMSLQIINQTTVCYFRLVKLSMLWASISRSEALVSIWERKEEEKGRDGKQKNLQVSLSLVISQLNSVCN